MSFYFSITREASRDILETLAWSNNNFGPDARVACEALIIATLKQIQHDPTSLGTRDRGDLAVGARSLHLRPCRSRVRRGMRKVGRPRHLAFYQCAKPKVRVVRLLHESADTNQVKFDN